jgi:hypothetical protein
LFSIVFSSIIPPNYYLLDNYNKKDLINFIGLENENLEKLSVHDINSLEVLREKLRKDILVNFKNSKIMIVIENKIFSSEHRNQMKKYQKMLKETYDKKYQYSKFN